MSRLMFGAAVTVRYEPVVWGSKRCRWRYEWEWDGRHGHGWALTFAGAFLAGWRGPFTLRRTFRINARRRALAERRWVFK